MGIFRELTGSIVFSIPFTLILGALFGLSTLYKERREQQKLRDKQADQQQVDASKV